MKHETPESDGHEYRLTHDWYNNIVVDKSHGPHALLRYTNDFNGWVLYGKRFASFQEADHHRLTLDLPNFVGVCIVYQERRVGVLASTIAVSRNGTIGDAAADTWRGRWWSLFRGNQSLDQQPNRPIT